MGKMKTKRGVAKRIKVTGTGKLLRRQMGHNHLLSKKARARKRRLKEDRGVHARDRRHVRRCVPYA